MADKYLEERIKNISDEDLFSSMKPWDRDLAKMRASVSIGDHGAAFSSWRSHLGRRVAKAQWDGRGSRRQDIDYEHVIGEADLVVARDIKCWGGIRIKYRGEIDFSRNLGGSSNYGFHYFGWISPLNEAYRLTADEKYARAFAEIFTQWYKQRDLVVGDNSGLDVIWYELGCNRSRTFRDHYFSMIDSESFREPELHRLMLKTLLGHCRWLYRHQTAYQSGNWQVFGAQTLTSIGLSFPEFRESGRWVRRGLRWILDHTRRDVFPDGCHRERAPHYHLGVVHSFWDVYRMLMISRGYGAQKRQIGAAVRDMLLWTLGISTPSGHSPAVGDSEYDIPQEDFLKIGLALRNGRLVWGSRASAASVRALARESAVSNPVKPKPPTEMRTNFPKSGFAVVRSGWERRDLYFLVNYGPYGGFHSHSEALAFQLWNEGSPLAVDCGRGISYDDPLHRSWYRSVHAHNAIAIDGHGPSPERSRGRMRFWNSRGDIDFLGFEHDGYQERGSEHQRFFLIHRKAGWVVVLDYVASKSNVLVDWNLNSPAPLRKRKEGALASGFAVLEAQPEEIVEIEKRTVRMALPIDGRSTWGVKRPRGSNLRIRKEGRQVRFAVLLASGRRAESSSIRVEDLPGSKYGMRIEVQRGRSVDSFEVNCRTGKLNASRKDAKNVKKS